jgi:hypothetical protein
MRIAKWNYNRNNTHFNKDLELTMLAEEAQEFKDGMTMYFESTNELEALEALVEMIDAWADYQFVAQGTFYKYLGSTARFDFDAIRTQEKYMFHTLLRLEIDETLLNEALDYVIIANEAKGTEKVDGKIQKGDTWVDPKFSIQQLLLDSDYV